MCFLRPSLSFLPIPLADFALNMVVVGTHFTRLLLVVPSNNQVQAELGPLREERHGELSGPWRQLAEAGSARAQKLPEEARGAFYRAPSKEWFSLASISVSPVGFSRKLALAS